MILRSTYITVVVVLAVGCDSLEEKRLELEAQNGFSIEVGEIKAVEPAGGPPAFQAQLQNVGVQPLSSVSVEFTLYPQHQLTSGITLMDVLPGEQRSFDVKLLHVDRHRDYTCYSSQLIAFAAGQKYAVIDRAGPTTCR